MVLDDRDTITLGSGPRVTAVRRWSREDEDIVIRSENAEQVRILPLVEGVIFVMQVGEIAIRASVTLEEFMFLFGATLATAKTKVWEWIDECAAGNQPEATAFDGPDADRTGN